MARNDLVLETLLKLCKEDNPETRRNAVVTILDVSKAMSLVLGLGLIWFDSCFVFVIVKNFCGRRVLKKC